jgi:hypothetical protein
MPRSHHHALFAIALAASFLFPLVAAADTLFVSPSSGTYKVGQTFSIRIVVSSPAQAINAVSASLTYPTDKLQVTSISKIGSILNLWVAEPSFSNSSGTISLEGVVPNPGYIGSSGPVLTVNFRVVGTGPATVRYSSGSLLANDGYGTNVLRNKNPGEFTLTAAPAAEPAASYPTPASAQEETPDEGEYTYPTPSKAEEPAAQSQEDNVIAFEVPTFESIYSLIVKILSVAIPLIALVYFLLMTFHRGNQSVRKIRKDLRKDLHSIDRIVEKSFDIIKEDISDSIHMLERARTKRKLTSEEDAIIHRLRQNLVDAEKVIQAEISHAEKDIGD